MDNKEKIGGLVILLGIIGLFWYSSTRKSEDQIMLEGAEKAKAAAEANPGAPIRRYESPLWPPAGTPSFDGEPCSQGCAALQAGYDWAGKNFITDVDDCNEAGERYNSPYFASGCRKYIDDGKYEDKVQ